MFGFTMNEILHHNIEKLMPEIYAKYHSKIVLNALNKGAENISKKERLVFARHKSGFVFPVWISFKMVETLQNGLQFVATF